MLAGRISTPALAAAIMEEHVIVEEVNPLARLINLLLILRILDADVMQASRQTLSMHTSSIATSPLS